MNDTKRKKITSTSLSDFFRFASTQEKNQFYAKVVQEAIKDQKEMIAKAQNTANA